MRLCMVSFAGHKGVSVRGDMPLPTKGGKGGYIKAESTVNQLFLVGTYSCQKAHTPAPQDKGLTRDLTSVHHSNIYSALS